MTSLEDLCYVRQNFVIGQLVKINELEYLEDTLYYKLKSAIGTINRVIPIYQKSNWWLEQQIIGYVYEVIWIWPNKETCIGHYKASELMLTKNTLGISFRRWFKGKEKWDSLGE